MGNINVVQIGDSSLLEPLTCRRATLDIPICGIPLKQHLIERWGKTAASDCRPVYVASNFWPSVEMTEYLAGITDNFTLLSQDKTPVAWRSRTEMPDSNALVVESDVTCFHIVYPWHILKINEDLLSRVKENKIEGLVREGVTNDGVLVLGEGTVILPGVYIEGVVMIGRNCKIGPNCYIRGNTYVGDSCHVGQAVELKNCLIMNNVSIGHLTYLGDSIVCPKTNFGAGTIASNFRHDEKNHRSMVKGQLIDTARRKFGTIVGDNVHTGIHTTIYPGRKLWADTQTRPGDVVQKDILSMKTT